MSTDLDTIIKRLDECDEQRRNPPAALKTALLPAARQAAADLAALRIEHEAVCGLLTHTRKDRDDQRKRADMIISARHMIELQRAFPDRIAFHGDTLIRALADKDAAFWDDMPTLSDAGEVSGFGIASDPAASKAAA
jgi:hypothetical protein